MWKILVHSATKPHIFPFYNKNEATAIGGERGSGRERQKVENGRSTAQCQKDIKVCHQQSATKYLLGTMCRINYHFPSTYKRAQSAHFVFHFFDSHILHIRCFQLTKGTTSDNQAVCICCVPKKRSEKQLKYTLHFKLIRSLGLKLIFCFVHFFGLALSLS